MTWKLYLLSHLRPLWIHHFSLRPAPPPAEESSSINSLCFPHNECTSQHSCSYRSYEKSAANVVSHDVTDLRVASTPILGLNFIYQHSFGPELCSCNIFSFFSFLHLTNIPNDFPQSFVQIYVNNRCYKNTKLFRTSVCEEKDNI